MFNWNHQVCFVQTLAGNDTSCFLYHGCKLIIKKKFSNNFFMTTEGAIDILWYISETQRTRNQIQIIY